MVEYKNYAILGIGGTFMAGVAKLTKELGLQLEGFDNKLYPPMSDIVEALGITVKDWAEVTFSPDTCYIVGNVMKRGMPVIEELLRRKLPLLSGPEWLYHYVLKSRPVLAISGTHGKTTTSSMVAWILEHMGLNPGFLIGGVPLNFQASARLGTLTSPFVIEADEYDTAFFDKRSKFIHYHPDALIINNLEFDHADIFANLAAIQTQFHHLIRTMPDNATVIYPSKVQSITEVLAKGIWSKTKEFNSLSSLHAKKLTSSAKEFAIYQQDEYIGTVKWGLAGEHNIHNALAALTMAESIGIKLPAAIKSLNEFKSVKRRLEHKFQHNNITVYDDFAHHPTAIAATLQALRNEIGQEKVVAIFEPRSNSMQLGTHQTELAQAFQDSDYVFWYQNPNISWDLNGCAKNTKRPGGVFQDVNQLLSEVIKIASDNCHIVFMSNGSFNDATNKLFNILTK